MYFTKKSLQFSSLKLVIFGFALMGCLASCLSIRPLEFQKAENIVTTSTGADFEMTFDLNMYNPNNWSLRLTDVETDVMIDSLLLGKANLSEAVRLTRNSDFTLTMVAKSSNVDLTRIASMGLSLLTGNQTATATIKGNMTLKKFIFRRKFQFVYKEKVDARFLESLF